MMRMMLVFIAAMSCLSAQAAEPTPSRVHTRYVVLKSGIEIAEIDEVYTRDNDHYTLTSIARPLGLLAFFKPGKIYIHSNGLITNAGLKPVEFNYQREGDSGKNSDAQFSWEQRQLKLNHDGQHISISLPNGTQDRLSAMYQFMFISLRDQKNIDFAMTNGSKLDQYHYTVASGETMTTRAGKFDTLYLDSQAKAGETRTQLWLASTRFNLPCKLIITDPEGGKLTQELRLLDIQP